MVNSKPKFKEGDKVKVVNLKHYPHDPGVLGMMREHLGCVHIISTTNVEKNRITYELRNLGKILWLKEWLELVESKREV